MTVHRTRADRQAAIAAGIQRHIAGSDRAETRRAAKAAARAPVAPKAAPIAQNAQAAVSAAPAAPAAVSGPAETRRKVNVTQKVLDAARQLGAGSRYKRAAAALQSGSFLTPWQPPKGVLPKDAKPVKLAMDYAPEMIGQLGAGAVGSWGGDALSASFAEGIGFLGYSYLAALTQRAEYRRISERIATEMTRKWIRFHTVNETEEFEPKGPEAKPGTTAGAMGVPADPGEAEESEAVAEADETKQRVKDSVKRKKALDKAKRIKQLEDEMRRLKVKDAFYTLAEGDGWFGRYHLFLDVGADLDDRSGELATPIGNGKGVVSRAKVTKRRKLRRVQPVEPMWCYPAIYESVNPLKADWYNPEQWYVNGITVHRSRLLRFVGREVPDILKPAYAFGGLSMSQMAKPYVDNWLRTRQAVCDLIESFTVSGVYTNLAGALEEGSDEAMRRIEMFNITRANAGAWVLDKETEEFFNVSTPLGSLDMLQAQSQEQMSSVSGIPLVVLLGITPKGLNASSEGEMRAFYDTIEAFQEQFFRDHLQTVIWFIMLSLWGEVDDEITFSFVPLWSMTEKEKAEKRKLEAETDGMLIDKGVITNAEARDRVANDPDTPYNNLDPAEVPEMPEPDMGMGGDDPFGGGDDGGGEGGSEGSEADNPIGGAQDEWNEADHPRADNGQFGSGGSSPASPGAAATKSSSRPDSSSKSTSSTSMKSLSIANLKKTGSKLGSNEGGVYTNDAGEKFYVKKPKTKEHVANEMAAARLYQLAGVNTLKYRDAGPDHVATEWEKLDKNNISQMTPAEKKEAAKDFVVHAWLSNWDAAGTGGDNQGIRGGKPVTLDVGGSLRFRAQGGPKGNAFGPKVSELDTMRNPSMSPDAARLYGKMSEDDLYDAAQRVTSIPDASIRKAAGDAALADVLIARKGDIAKRFGVLAKDEADEALFKAAQDAHSEFYEDEETDAEEAIENEEDPPADLATDGIEERLQRLAKRRGDDSEHVAVVRYDGDFPMDKLLAHMRRLGSIGASRTIVAYDEEDRPVKFGWDGDGADKIRSVEIDGQRMAFDAALLDFDDTVYEVRPDVFAMALDEKSFDESKVKRDADGKFATTGAAGGKEGEKAEAGEKPKSKKEQIGAMLLAGTTPKELMQAMGWPSVSMPAQAQSLGMKLEKKDGKYFGIKMTPEELEAFKKEQAAKKAAKPEKGALKTEAPPEKKGDLGSMAGKPAPKLNEQPTSEVVQEVIQQFKDSGITSYSTWLGAVAEAASKSTGQKEAVTKLFKDHPEYAAQYKSLANPEMVAKMEKVAPGIFEKPKPKAPEASQADKQKAVKSTPVQPHLVPGDKPETETFKKQMAEKIQAFNDKWLNTSLTPQSPELNEKVADFKQLMADQADLVKVEKKQKAEILKAEQEKAAWELKQKQDAEKKELEEAFAKNPDLKTHYEAMESLFSGKSAAASYIANAAAKLKQAKLDKHLTPEEAVGVIAYTGSHYAALNDQLRKGQMTVPQYKLMKSINAGLDKMPAYEGVTYRKASLTPEQFALYKPGMVVEERGFTSTSKNQGVWSGSHHYTVHGKSGRDVQKISNHKNEAEVLFKSGTRFYVEKVEGNHITLREL